MSGSRHRRRRRRNRRRELIRLILAGGFVCAQLIGFLQANFAIRDSWTELFGFLVLQPAQILLNLADGQWKLTRGMSDKDAVMLVTLVSVPLNCLLWYGVWRGWRALAKSRRRKRRRLMQTAGMVDLHRTHAGGSGRQARVLVGSLQPTSPANSMSITPTLSASSSSGDVKVNGMVEGAVIGAEVGAEIGLRE